MRRLLCLILGHRWSARPYEEVARELEGMPIGQHEPHHVRLVQCARCRRYTP